MELLVQPGTSTEDLLFALTAEFSEHAEGHGADN